MILSKLGQYIKLSEKRNVNLEYEKTDVKGISINKVFIETKANLNNVSLKAYKVIKPRYFAYVTVTSRNGERVSLAYNDSQETYIVSSSYVSFFVINEEELMPEYLYIYFNRPEFDRIARFNSWGSARETFSWDDLCDLNIYIPDIEIQKKYVAIYKSLVESQVSIENSLEELNLISQIGIENLRDKYSEKAIKEYIKEHKTINKDLKIKTVKSLNRELGFLKTTRKINNKERYKIINHNDIVYPPPHFGEVGTIGIYKDVKQALVSPMYITFSVNEKYLLPDYLFMWFKRRSFMRFAFFSAASSIRDTFDFDMLSEYKIPFPPLDVQQSLVDLYLAYEERRKLNEETKQIIKDICPVLISGAIKEPKGVI